MNFSGLISTLSANYAGHSDVTLVCGIVDAAGILMCRLILGPLRLKDQCFPLSPECDRQLLASNDRIAGVVRF
jgi:hypothetical protein